LWDKSGAHEAKDAALWFLDPVALNRHAGHRRTFARDILAFDIDDDLEQYLPDQVNARKVVRRLRIFGQRDKLRLSGPKRGRDKWA
jgi:hypothetical protein